MFFFFVGGLEQQAGRVIKEGAGRCIRCGSVADLVEVENVLKLFFVPVRRWPSKQHAFYCRDCSLLSPHSLPPIDADGGGRIDGETPAVPPLPQALRCGSCGSAVDPQFRFCPYCGFAL